MPRATLFTPTGRREWTSALLPRYQRRLREVNQAVIATYLAGGNTRRLRGALAPLLKGAPLSRSAVSRIIGTLHAELEAWRTRSYAASEAAARAAVTAFERKGAKRCPGSVRSLQEGGDELRTFFGKKNPPFGGAAHPESWRSRCESKQVSILALWFPCVAGTFTTPVPRESSVPRHVGPHRDAS